MAREVIIDVGQPEFVWCDRCMKSTRYVIHLNQLRADGVMPMGRIERCTEGEHHA